MYLLEVCDKSKISLYGHRVFFYVLCDRLFKLEEGAMHIGVLFICKQVSCTREWHHENRTITSSFIERKYLNESGSNRNGSLADFRDRVSIDLRAKVTLSQVKRVKRKAISLLDGDIKDQFKMKWDYCNEMDRTNLGSTIRMKFTGNKVPGQPYRFKRIYICFAACKFGFKAGC
ncbi:hypothetical protein KY284_035348 [Solanum tuberosum]|nr:hypothetical protein KY284_035348 [Solanum tuberosum]